MKTFIKVIKTIGNIMIMILGIKGEYLKEAEAAGICHFDGQG